MDAAFFPIKFVFLLLLGGIFRSNKASHATSTSGEKFLTHPNEDSDKASNHEGVTLYPEDQQGSVDGSASTTSATEGDAHSEGLTDTGVSGGIGDGSNLLGSTDTDGYGKGLDAGSSVVIGVAAEVSTDAASLTSGSETNHASELPLGTIDGVEGLSSEIEADLGGDTTAHASHEATAGLEAEADLISNSLLAIEFGADKTDLQTDLVKTEDKLFDELGQEEFLLGEDLDLELGATLNTLVTPDPLVSLDVFGADLRELDLSIDFAAQTSLEVERIAFDKGIAEVEVESSLRLFPELQSPELALNGVVDGLASFDPPVSSALTQSVEGQITADDGPVLSAIETSDDCVGTLLNAHLTVEEQPDALELCDDVGVALNNEDMSHSNGFLFAGLEIGLDLSTQSLNEVCSMVELDIGSLPIVPMNDTENCYMQYEDEADQESGFLAFVF